MRVLFENGDDAMDKLTPAQILALDTIREKWHLPEPVKVSPLIAGDGAVMVDVGSMWLGVEPDGYTHS